MSKLTKRHFLEKSLQQNNTHLGCAYGENRKIMNCFDYALTRLAFKLQLHCKNVMANLNRKSFKICYGNFSIHIVKSSLKCLNLSISGRSKRERGRQRQLRGQRGSTSQRADWSCRDGTGGSKSFRRSPKPRSSPGSWSSAPGWVGGIRQPVIYRFG